MMFPSTINEAVDFTIEPYDGELPVPDCTGCSLGSGVCSIVGVRIETDDEVGEFLDVTASMRFVTDDGLILENTAVLEGVSNPTDWDMDEIEAQSYFDENGIFSPEEVWNKLGGPKSLALDLAAFTLLGSPRCLMHQEKLPRIVGASTQLRTALGKDSGATDEFLVNIIRYLSTELDRYSNITTSDIAAIAELTNEELLPLLDSMASLGKLDTPYTNKDNGHTYWDLP